MKLFRTIFMAMVAIISLSTTTSCSDNDDKDTPAIPAAKNIEGSYTGDMDCSVMGNVSTFADVTFGITATDDATVSITLPPFGEAPMAMPSITVDGVKVTEEDGIATLASTQITGETTDGKSYTVTLSGSVADNTLDIRFNLQFGAMPMPMICSSTAVK